MIASGRGQQAAGIRIVNKGRRCSMSANPSEPSNILSLVPPAMRRSFRGVAETLDISEEDLAKQCLVRGFADVCRDLNAYDFQQPQEPQAQPKNTF